jgi:hypothetical protein
VEKKQGSFAPQGTSGRVEAEPRYGRDRSVGTARVCSVHESAPVLGEGNFYYSRSRHHKTAKGSH